MDSKFTEDKLRRFEDDPDIVDEVKPYGGLLAAL
jgi:hypothetical protein